MLLEKYFMLDIFSHIDLNHWVRTLGYFGVLTIVFCESGVFFCFLLPGDSLVFTAGLLASQGVFNIWILAPALMWVAFLGYIFGYWFGNKLGEWLMQRKESVWFRKKYIYRTRAFYEKHGGKTIIIGRLVPIVRTFAPIVAGMAQMSYRKYLLYNAIGAVIWGGGITIAGYFLGGLVPGLMNYLLPLASIVVILSILPGIYHFIKERFKR